MTDLLPTGDPYLDSYSGPRPLVGELVTAQRRGRCVICGELILEGERYYWSAEHRRGAHSRACGVPAEKVKRKR